METNTNVGPRWLLMLIGVLLSVFLLLSGIDKGLAIKNSSKPSAQNTFPVTGEGKVSAVPDLATITLGILSQGATARIVQDDSAKKINDITAFVKKEGIDEKDIQTSQNSVYPTQDYRDGKQTITGYQGNYTITIKVHGADQIKDKLGSIIAGVTDNGANQINGVSLSVDNPDSLRQQAQEIAIENAKQKAQALAAKAGLKLGRIVSISDSGSGGYPVPYAADSAYGLGAAEKSFAPSIQPGSQDITANMTIVFELK